MTVAPPASAVRRRHTADDPAPFVNGIPQNGTQRLIFIARVSASICVKVFARQQG
jgi:hypothetical protein